MPEYESSIEINSLEKVDPHIIAESMEIYKTMINSATEKYASEPCSICSENRGRVSNTGLRTHFHGSEFGKCFRQTQYNLLSPRKKIEDPFKGIFLRDGHLHEIISGELLAHNYKTSPKDEEIIIERYVELNTSSENPIKVKVKIVCHTDLTLISGSHKFIVEFKATKKWYFDNRAKKRIIANHYYGQTQIYMEAYNVDYCLLFFKNRESSEILHPIVIKRDPYYIRRRFGYLAGIQYMLTIPQLVDREYINKNCDSCKFCDFNKQCWS